MKITDERLAEIVAANKARKAERQTAERIAAFALIAKAGK